MFQAWNDRSVRFLEDAERETGLYQRIAEQCLPFIPEGAVVMDCGCGVGYLSRNLAARAGRIIAVDLSPVALSCLRASLSPEETERILVIEGDVFALQETIRCDIVLSCFFGSVEENLRIARRHGAKSLLIIRKAGGERRFDAEAACHMRTAESAVLELHSLGLAFHELSFEAEMGQPLRSAAEACDFLRLWSSRPERVSLEDALSRTRESDNPEFPLFLPARRKLCILSVSLG